MFTKHLANIPNIEQFVSFIETATARSRDVAMVTDLWRMLAKIGSFCSLAFHNRWKDRNVDCRINTAVNALTSHRNCLRTDG